MHPPRIELGSPAWKADIIPLYYGCYICYTYYAYQESNLDLLIGNQIFYH